MCWRQTLEVKKIMLSSCLKLLRRLRDHGSSRKKTKSWGACGQRTFKDAWTWPKNGSFLFPNREGTGPMTKDIVCHNITKVRKSFRAPPGSVLLDPATIRSHSGRHRMINDLKFSGVPCDAAMQYARIKNKRTFERYGRMDAEQSGQILQSNKKLKAALSKIYG